uniref:Arm_2 domain-containing protein n=1 Tax=Macrostomum lignano TaxID=282301 RepID=A0A1I8HEW4_9PLAT
TGRYASSTIGDSRQRILPAYSTEQQYDPAFANPGYSDLGDFYPIENGAARAVSPAYSNRTDRLVSHAVAETILLESRPPQTAEPQSSSYRDPELPDLLQLLRSGSDEARCHAAAYLQHLTFCEEDTKTRVRTSGGIILLVNLLARPGSVNLRLGVLGALRNLSFGLGQEENRREMARCGLLANLCALVESAEEQEVRELATAVLWNLSASPALRKDMLDTCVTPLVNRVLLPHAGLERAPSGEFNSVQREIYWTGVLRCAVRNTDLDRKSIENCVCLLRNLLFACQETADPNYQPAESIAPAQLNSNSKSGKSGGGCFGGKSSSNGGPSSSSSKKKQQPQQKPASKEATPQQPLAGGGGRISLLWQAGTLSSVLLPIIADCANPDTLEAAAGAVQNLAACDWQPSVEFRAQIRRDKGLPLLVELLSLDADRVVRTAATALRNLALEAQSLKLIGQYALEALTSRLPRRNSPIANSPETYAAVIAALYAVVKTSPVYARRLAELGGPSGLILVRDAPSRYGQKSSAFAARLLDSMQQLLGKDVQLLSLQNRQQQQQQQ